MQTATRLMIAGWVVLALVIGSYEITYAYLIPHRDDLGLGMVVLSALFGGCGIAGAIMGTGATWGTYLLASMPSIRTTKAVVTTVLSGLATLALARVLTSLVWGI